MSTLSKVWNSIWTYLSSLDFGDNYLHNSKNTVVNLPNYRFKALDDLIKVLITGNIKELFIDVGVYTHNKFL